MEAEKRGLDLFAGKPVKTRISLNELDFIALLHELAGKKFVGVVYLTTLGQKGFEEGLLAFDAGKIVGCSYEYAAFEKKFFGREALDRLLNASAASNGVIDVFEHSPDELHALLSQDTALVYSVREKDLVKPKKYSREFEQELIDEKLGKASLFKKLRFRGI